MQAPVREEPRIIRGNDHVFNAPTAVPPVQGSASSYKFEDAPIVDVVHVFMREVLKVDYVLHQPLGGSVTLATRGPISPDDGLALLESALQANGLAMARDTRGVYHVGKPENLKSVASNIRQAGKDPLPPGYGAVIVPLQYIGANEMATILRPLAPGDAIVRVDNVRNLLVLVGTRNQAEGWLDLVRTFDVDLLKGMSVGLFPLKHASVKEVEAALQLVSGGAPSPASRGAGAARAAAASAPGAGATAGGAAAAGGASASAIPLLSESNPLFGALRILPVERLNSILVVTPRASYLEEARRWIEKLDQPSDGGAEPQLYIYRVQNGNARHLAGVLGGIFGGTAPAGAAATGVAPGLGSAVGASQGQSFGNMGTGFGSGYGGGFGSGYGSGFGTGMSSGFGRTGSTFPQQNRLNQVTNQPPATAQLGNVRVMADDLNNTILVWATKAEFDKIESTLKRLDLPPTQVLIEASIVEVTLNDDLNYGLQWAFSGSAGSDYQGAGQIGAGGVRPNTGSLSDAMGKGFTYSLVNSAGQIRVALSALATKTKVKMISNPSLMVLDNHLAMMVVGNQVPVQSSTITGETSLITTSTVQYRDTGVNLAVTPSVNAGNLVTMQIDQIVTDAADNPSGNGNNQPIFLQRQISSKVAVRSGESIVLGGLIKDSQSAGKSGVPVLQDLPLVGNLFGTNTNGGARTELLVVITPKVVRTDPEIREVSEELRDRLRGLESLQGAPRSMPAPAAAPAVLQPLPAQ